MIAKSFARIHRSNLIEVGVLPIRFRRGDDYECIGQDEDWEIPELSLVLQNMVTQEEIPLHHTLTAREIELFLAGAAAPYSREQAIRSFSIPRFASARETQRRLAQVSPAVEYVDGPMVLPFPDRLRLE